MWLFWTNITYGWLILLGTIIAAVWDIIMIRLQDSIALLRRACGKESVALFLDSIAFCSLCNALFWVDKSLFACFEFSCWLVTC